MSGKAKKQAWNCFSNSSKVPKRWVEYLSCPHTIDHTNSIVLNAQNREER